MSKYLYGSFVTKEACAANNRGRNVGNQTTLQKAVYNGEDYSCVSAEALRFALRYRLQQEGLKVNRAFDKDTNRFIFADEKHLNFAAERYADDDLFGFMTAEAAKVEAEEAGVVGVAVEGEAAPEGKKGPKAPKAKGRAQKRTSPLAVTRALSLRPWNGESTFNCVGGVKEKGSLSLYGAEMHTTAYQYTVGLSLGDVVSKENIGHLVDALVDPPPVAGNHSRFYYEFSPESAVFRLTSAHCGRITNIFDYDDSRRGPSLTRLVEEVECGDVPANELVLGGAVANTPEGEKLKSLGVTVFRSVTQAQYEVKRRVADLGAEYATVAVNVPARETAKAA